MKKLRWIALTTILLGSAALLGCGGGGGVDSGVDGSKQGNELNDDEVEAVCEATIEYQAKSVNTNAACRQAGAVAYLVAGFGGQDPVAACEMARDTCIEEAAAAESDEPNTLACSAFSASQVEDCTATVSEVEDCLTALVDLTADAINSTPDCNELETAEPPMESEEVETPAACETVSENCGIALDLAGGPTDVDPGDFDFGLGGAPGQ